MEFKREVLIVMLVVTAMLTACASSGTWRVGCTSRSSGEWECTGEVGGSFKQSPSETELDKYDLRYFDASKLKVRTTNSNVTLKTSNNSVSFTIRLYDNGALVGAKTFAASTPNNSTIKALSDSSVTSWVQQFDGMVDTFKVDLNNVEFAQTGGSNTVVLEAYYDSSLDSGGSWSEYINPICLAKPWICDDDPYLN